MVVLGGMCHELHPKAEKNRKPMGLVSCMVKNPCCCCGLSLFVAILTTLIGFRILIQNSGPFGPFKVGVDYPNQHLIARQSDALMLAITESKSALLASGSSVQLTEDDGGKGGGRRLDAEMVDEEEPEPTMFEFAVERLLGPKVAELLRVHMEHDAKADEARRRRQLSSQEQQTEVMAIALLVVSARDGVTNLYDDEGLQQMCRFRDNMMLDRITWPDYCLREAQRDYTGSGEAPMECNTGIDVLNFFYGDAAYDIDQISLSVFETPSFDSIVNALVAQDLVALGAFPAADRIAVQSLYTKLLGYLMGAWTDSSYKCTAAYKKDVPKVLDVLARVRAAPSLASFNAVLNQYFDRDFSVANPVTRNTKAFYTYGAPLAGFDNYVESAAVDAQDAQYALWWYRRGENFPQYYPEGVSTMWPTGQPTVLNTQLILQEILLLLIGDGIRAIAPAILVFLTVWLQTRSLLIAAVTLTEIILSLTASVFVMTAVLQIKWASFQSALALYIVLAIGADDVFVFMDAYKQSFYKGKDVNESLATRMSWVYRRAGLAMLITSLTTCSAFIASAVASPIPELQNFGIFAAFVILLDYLLVMTFLCANSILFHNHFEMKPALCCACCGECGECTRTHPCTAGGCEKLCQFKDLQTTTEKAQAEDQQQAARPTMVRFFEDVFPFNLVVKNAPARAASMLVCVAYLMWALTSATKIRPQTAIENFLPDSHPFQRYQAIESQFEASTYVETVEINFVWGFDAADPLDQAGVNLIFDADNKGEPNYLTGFALSPQGQLAILDACDALEAANATKIELDVETGLSETMTKCFMKGFKAYREYRNLTFPVATAEVDAAVLEWLEDTSSAPPAEARANSAENKFADDVGWVSDGADDAIKIAWVKVRASSRLGVRAFLPAAQLRDYYGDWQGVAAQVNAFTAGTALGAAFQVAGVTTGTSNKWVYMTLQEAYVRMALTGAGIGLGIATIVLLIATRNLIVTISCIGTIAAALVCVLGTIVTMGWSLGSNESLCIMILTGFAVDYVVHLAHAYMESKASTRLERVHDALRDLGISVFWGMTTSILAAGALATCQIQFFHKFGVFFALTIAFAYLWSIFFLMPLLACIGPEPRGLAAGVTVDGGAEPVKGDGATVAA